MDPQQGASRRDFSDLWNALAQGEYKICETFYTERYAQFVLVANDGPCCQSLPTRERHLLEQTLLVADRKVLAAELGLSESTLCCLLKQALEFIGLSCSPSQAPPLLALAVFAAQNPGGIAGSWVLDPTSKISVASAARPELTVRDQLSPSEFGVIELLLKGQSYAQIARSRSATGRTIANQVAASFRKLRVSGRSQLVRRLVQGLDLERKNEASRAAMASRPSSSESRLFL